jgi:lipopolysaccharide biosynthesis glycosyltransferase
MRYEKYGYENIKNADLTNGNSIIPITLINYYFMKNEVIHIACALDDNYVMPVGVMLVSLFETNKTNKFRIHVFSTTLKKESIERLSTVAERYKKDLEFYHLDQSVFENFITNERISLASYNRILIPEVINKDIDKILYLDGDIIINGNIRPLWETDLQDYIIGVVDDPVAIDVNEIRRLKIPEQYGYFNTGMALINNKKWRDNKTTQKVLTYLNDNKQIIKFHDQDGLNGILYDKVKKLSPTWNQQVGLYYCLPDLIHSIFPGTDLKKVIKTPVIVHFNSREKPWHYVSLHPFAKKFKYYMRLSGLKNYTEEITLRKFIKKQAYRLLGWRRLNRYIYSKQRLIQFEK